MRNPVSDRVRCVLSVQRLIDADLLLPEEGNALLAEIEAWNPPTDNTEAQRTRAERFIQVIEAVIQTDRFDDVTRKIVLETARILIHQPIHQPADSTAPETQWGKPRD